jgi:hypothetical protein
MDVGVSAALLFLPPIINKSEPLYETELSIEYLVQLLAPVVLKLAGKILSKLVNNKGVK